MSDLLPVAGPLNGLRILDLTHVWAGPLAVRFLADLGAEVVRVEAPLGRGTREFPSQPIGGWLGGEPGDDPWNNNALMVKLTRNRRSLCLDLKQETGRTTFLRLVKKADVLIENFSARAMPSLGLDKETLFAANPRLIYVTMPGFGHSGPLKDRVAFGPTVEVMSGLTNVFGYGPKQPRNTAMALMDPICGVNAVSAVIEAVRERAEQGTEAGPTYIEMSLHEGGVAYSGPWLIDHQLGNAVQSLANRHLQIAPHGVFSCMDSTWIALACVCQEQWHGLCELIDGLSPNWDLVARQGAEDEIESHVARWCGKQKQAEAVLKLQAAGVAAGPVNTTPDMLADEQIRAREYFANYERFNTPMPGNPIVMPGLDNSQWQPSPALGNDNESVLRDWLGLQPDDIRDLQHQAVLNDQPPH